MPFGDLGGVVTELIITCQTVDVGEVDISRGDALRLVGPYTVSNVMDEGDAIFGEALRDARDNAVALPVKVRGISRFPYTGPAPRLDGRSGVIGALLPGMVRRGSPGMSSGIVVKVEPEQQYVHVLL